MQVYVAMPADTASRVDEAKHLTRANLGLPYHVQYLPLKDTKVCAVDTCMTGHAMVIPMARESSVWRVLEINVPQEAAFKMVQDAQLVRPSNRNGWRFFGNLDFSTFSHQWYEVSVPPMGVDAWTKKTLMPIFHVTANAVCCKCNKQGARWRMHCADCWLDFLHRGDA